MPQGGWPGSQGQHGLPWQCDRWATLGMALEHLASNLLAQRVKQWDIKTRCGDPFYSAWGLEDCLHHQGGCSLHHCSIVNSTADTHTRVQILASSADLCIRTANGSQFQKVTLRWQAHGEVKPTHKLSSWVLCRMRLDWKLRDTGEVLRKYVCQKQPQGSQTKTLEWELSGRAHTFLRKAGGRSHP